MRKISALTSAAALIIAAPLLTACTGGTATAEPVAATTSAAPEVTISDAWAKAGEGMTGMFGTLHNDSAYDLTITTAASDAAGMVELHEVTADGMMRKIQGDVVIPAGGTFELVPGGNHIMLMELSSPLLAGDEVTVTLTFDNGSTSTLTALVKDYSGANESYDDLAETDGHMSETDGSEHAAQ